MLCDEFLTFTYLDDVLPGDGGLACLPGSHNVDLGLARPTGIFGSFGEKQAWAVKPLSALLNLNVLKRYIRL